MRLRNIPRAEGVIHAHKTVINEPKEYRGRWQQVFENDHPVHIEIGMGKGQFLMGMAAAHPEINYVGIERYSSVLLRAVEKFDTLAGEEQPKNLRFVCMDARELAEVFAPAEVEKIYLNFSDPWPKARHASRRLTSRAFLAVYQTVLPEGGKVEFKTDNTGLFDFSLEEVPAAGWKVERFTYDLHHNEEMNAGNIMTEYEEKFSSQGNQIHKGIFVCQDLRTV